MIVGWLQLYRLKTLEAGHAKMAKKANSIITNYEKQQLVQEKLLKSDATYGPKAMMKYEKKVSCRSMIRDGDYCVSLRHVALCIQFSQQWLLKAALLPPLTIHTCRFCNRVSRIPSRLW